ncbi:hypothetical protein [Azospirillum lipoferum]|uniref:Uncharacterized protein n=1 Tax=Azospirillum lipoferum (strain 4B) TaxID=862719 RepID=G7ZHQ4_AZOL4|nr:hypothetical protein [Azospirillum lipoferum]CBS91062.1 protein of unknown function [Azospirillum lipoferum 4B]
MTRSAINKLPDRLLAKAPVIRHDDPQDGHSRRQTSTAGAAVFQADIIEAAVCEARAGAEG